MAPDYVQPFRFTDLPGEIRNEIYRILLCSFEPTTKPSAREPIQLIEHSIDTAILRTSKQIYAEAYDVMVKTNQFVHFTAELVSVMADAFVIYEIPVVTANHESIRRFKGYVLSVSVYMGTPKTPETSTRLLLNGISVPNTPLNASDNFMLLARDLHLVSKAITHRIYYLSSLTSLLDVSLLIAPMLFEHHSPPHDCFRYFFSEKMQLALVLPFKQYLRGIKSVMVRGAISCDYSIFDKIKNPPDEWTDARIVIRDLRHSNLRAARHRDEGKLYMAVINWARALADVTLIFNCQRPCPWTIISGKQGGREFCSKVVETYTFIRLKIIDAGLVLDRSGREGDLRRIADAFRLVGNAVEGNFCVRGFRWAPSMEHKARLWHKFTACLELVVPSVKQEMAPFVEQLRSLLINEGVLKE